MIVLSSGNVAVSTTEKCILEYDSQMVNVEKQMKLEAIPYCLLEVNNKLLTT